MKFYIFDDQYTSNFYPITLTRSTGDLRLGITKLRQKISDKFNFEETNLIIMPHLEKIYKERHSDWQINKVTFEDSIFINSRIKNYDKLIKEIASIPQDSKLINNNQIVAFRTKPIEANINSREIENITKNLTPIRIDNVDLWNYLWELIEENGKAINRDFKDYFYDKENFVVTEPGVTIINPYQVWLGDKTELKPGVIIDATDGAVIIDEEAEIMHNAVIIGPVYIGKKSKIKVGAKIYEGTSIGPVCKIGGEVEESIIQAYSNKQHDGFLGHSYLGEWVNLGADTNNSDLKNNYKTVKVYNYPEKKKIDSKTRFMGTIIGDHSKTGINSTINTGTVIGVGCNLFGREVISDFVPDFSWGEYKNLTNYKIEKFIETATIVKSRRKLTLTENEKLLYNKIAKKELT
jgi:UDP-N-acetylglucosamine diphosphorylase/glucosamine-1-phosphate N-acetyltransferase